jgi:DNA invertase Pin-like site-specific DNA recombinase
MIRVYCRVSTEDQKLDSQHGEVDRWLKSQPRTKAERYSDEGYSRLTAKGRPGWAKLMKDVKPGDLVVFPSLDRAIADLLEYLSIRDQFRKLGVGYWYIRESMGWKPGEEPNHFTDALEEILAVFGKLETRIRRARQKAGIAAVKKQVAAGKRAHWFLNGPPRKRKPRKLDAGMLRDVKTLAAAGRTITEIAKRCKLSRKAVYIALGRWKVAADDTVTEDTTLED